MTTSEASQTVRAGGQRYEDGLVQCTGNADTVTSVAREMWIVETELRLRSRFLHPYYGIAFVATRCSLQDATFDSERLGSAITCIVGKVTKDGCVLIGGDSAGVSGLSVMVRKDFKVFTKGGFAYGFCGSFRMGQLLAWEFQSPAHAADISVDQYIRTTWIDAVRASFNRGGYLLRENNQEYGGTFMVGYRGRLFTVHGDFQVGESIHDFNAIGCGDDLALGAMYALRDSKLSDEERLGVALEAAQEFNGGVRAPFSFVKLPAHVAPKVKGGTTVAKKKTPTRTKSKK